MLEPGTALTASWMFVKFPQPLESRVRTSLTLLDEMSWEVHLESSHLRIGVGELVAIVKMMDKKKKERPRNMLNLLMFILKCCYIRVGHKVEVYRVHILYNEIFNVDDDQQKTQ